MRKKSLNKLTLSIGCFLLGAPVMANDFSPYSPAYIVDSGQVLSDTRASVTWVNNRSYDHANAHGYDYPSYSSKNTDLDIGQSFTIGLPEDFQIGASVNYSDLVQANPYQAASRVGELDNPTFFLDKFWNTDSVLWGKVSFSATPKTGDSGAKAAPSMYKIGLSGIYIADESLVTSLGLTQSIVDPIYPDASNATSLNGVASKTLGAYLVNVKLGIQRVEPWLYTSSYTSGSYNSNYQAQGNQSWMYSGGQS